MNKVFLTLVALLMTVMSANAFIDSYTISRDKLPEETREMLDEHFPKAKVSMIKVDRHLLKKTDYDVRLTNGTKIEFTNKGKWTSVDCGKRSLPADLVPKAISRYVSKNYSDAKIVRICKRNAGYDVGISGNLTLRFNLLGQFKKILNAEEIEEEEEAEAASQDMETASVESIL